MTRSANKPEFHVQDLGEKHLKNVARPIRAYALTAADAPGQLRSPPGGEADRSTRRKLLMGAGALLIIAIVAHFDLEVEGLTPAGCLPVRARRRCVR